MYRQKSIGYTTAFSENNDRLIKIEILGDSISSTEKMNFSDPLPLNYINNIPETETYLTDKFKLLEVYDFNGNVITNRNDIDYILCEQQTVIDIGLCTYYKSMERGLQELRKKLFFNEIKIDISDYFDDDISDGKYITIYKKKCNMHDILGSSHGNERNTLDLLGSSPHEERNTQINFTGIQKMYDSYGNVTHEFYHNNGIKEGNFFVYNYFTNYIINFVNDKQIGNIEIYNQHII